MNFYIAKFIEKVTRLTGLLMQPDLNRQNTAVCAANSQIPDITYANKLGDSHVSQELEKTMLNEQFHLEYHPQFEIHRGRLIGFEALLRLDSGLFRYDPAEKFVPLMEENQMIYQAWARVFDTVCRQRREWHDSGVLAPDCRIAIKLSAGLLLDDKLYPLINKILKQYRLSATMLELQIPQNILKECSQYLREQLRQLHDCGFRLTVNDFDTDYPSLASLIQFHVDILRLDKKIIHHISANPKFNTYVSVVIKLAHRLGMKIIGEGVETGAQLSILRQLGCDYVQGHLFSRSLLPEELTDFVLWWRSADSEQRGWNISGAMVYKRSNDSC